MATKPACRFVDDVTGEGPTIVCERCGALVARPLASNHVREHERTDRIAAIADAAHRYDDTAADPARYPVEYVIDLNVTGGRDL